METFDYYFDASIGNLVLGPSDNLSAALQKSTLSVAGHRIATMTKDTLVKIRTDGCFDIHLYVCCDET